MFCYKILKCIQKKDDNFVKIYKNRKCENMQKKMNFFINHDVIYNSYNLLTRILFGYKTARISIQMHTNQLVLGFFLLYIVKWS